MPYFQLIATLAAQLYDKQLEHERGQLTAINKAISLAKRIAETANQQYPMIH